MTAQTFIPQYAARAVVDLEKMANRLKANRDLAEWRMANLSVAALIRHAVHIILPENGEVYRDNSIGGAMPTQDECESFAGLPAPISCFQYRWSHQPPQEEINESTCKAPKRITLVLDGKQFDGPSPPASATYVSTIFSVYFDERYRAWFLARFATSIAQPLEVFSAEDSWGWNQAAIDLVQGKWANPLAHTPDPTSPAKLTGDVARHVGQLMPDITAVVQCLHSLRAGARLEAQTEKSASRRKKFDRLGVGGFTYHVLRLPGHRADACESAGGTHASPRLHIRRAHIRKLPTGVLTFVRQCFVGDPARGVVEKHYKVAGE